MTMRSVAAELGTSAAGLYRYVGSREEILSQMVDLISAEVVQPEPRGEWLAELIGAATSQRALFGAHPWMVEATGSVTVFGPHVLDHLDWGLRVLEPLPAPVSRKLEAIALANGVAALFAPPARSPDPQAFSALDGSRQPQLAAALAQAQPTAASPEVFERVLTGVLRGALGE